MAGWRQVERWWNRSWGTRTRRYITLSTDGVRWRLDVSRGDDEVWAPFDTEDAARDYLQALLDDPKRGPWKRLD